MDGYVGGFMSGIAQTLIGHPLDTLKTWSQNTNLVNQPRRTFLNMWRGIQYPMVQLPIVCSVSFGLYENIYKATNDRITAGMMSGLIRTVIISPLEYYKINLQQQIKPVWRESYKNMSVVALKEMPSATVYYTTYHYLKEKEYPILLSGSIAGVSSWFSIYPLDTIKTRLQSGLAKSVREAIRQRNLWSGLHLCLGRAFITNGIGFYVYEVASSAYRGEVM